MGEVLQTGIRHLRPGEVQRLQRFQSGQLLQVGVCYRRLAEVQHLQRVHLRQFLERYVLQVHEGETEAAFRQGQSTKHARTQFLEPKSRDFPLSSLFPIGKRVSRSRTVSLRKSRSMANSSQPTWAPAFSQAATIASGKGKGFGNGMIRSRSFSGPLGTIMLTLCVAGFGFWAWRGKSWPEQPPDRDRRGESWVEASQKSTA